MSIAKNSKTSENPVVILHLSDLHFGWDGDERERTDRDLALKGLLHRLTLLDVEWRPNVVCISGDIGWQGKSSDYEDAEQWIRQLLAELELSADALFVCPGNHDLDQGLARYARPHGEEEADKILALPFPEYLLKTFEAFATFCKNLGIPPFKLGEKESYIVGQRSYRELSFISYNSAWFCTGGDDKSKLWLGLPLIKFMESKEQLPHPDKLREWPITIALLHHPREWFHEAELEAYKNRPSTFDYLCRRCHLLLTGHTHGEVRRAEQFAECTWHLSGGAAYAGASHFNSFRIIRVENDRFVYQSFEFDSRSTDNAWRPVDGARTLPFRGQSEKLPIELKKQQTSDLPKYREKAIEDAQRLIERKSRALKPSGQLPKTLPLNVSVHVKGPRHRFTPEGELAADPKKTHPMPLFTAARQSRRTLLLGDLGTGKSTLAGIFVRQTMEENKQSLACIIPAKELNLPQSLTVKNLLRAVSEYFNNQISPAMPGIDIEFLLNQRVEISLVIDGLDEIPKQAAGLLGQLGALVYHWPNIEVMATGRPVELVGINYEDWQVLTTIPLTGDEKLQFLEEEAIADGKSEGDAKEIAWQLLRKLNTLPALNSLATSPLAIRLLYSRLLVIQEGEAPTLGELLHELIKERLGEWAKKDVKQPTTKFFESEFPDNHSRAVLLGKLALQLEKRKNMPVEEARLRLQNMLRREGGPNELVLADEALRFFAHSGIVLIDNELQFPIQPLFEALCGYGLAELWRTSSEVAWLNPHHWRIVSFAATALRKFGLIESLRPRLRDFLEKLLFDERNVPAASYIVSESQDKICAEAFITGLTKLGPRPLTLLQDERGQAARTIAESIKLAGQIGFDWLFDHYLHPHYPIINTGSGVITSVFTEWAYLSADKITDYEKERLSTMIMPHMGAGTHQVINIIPLLAVLIPDEFELSDRLWLCGKFLGQGTFSTRAEQQFKTAFESGHQELVNGVLLKHAQHGHENAASAAWLWMKLNDGRPPSIIVRALVKARGYYRHEPNLDEYISRCINRIGEQSWEALLRWYLADSQIAAGAAIELYNRGERRLSLLGEPLLAALHDGGYVRRAEEILSRIIHDGGSRAVEWLAEHIAASESDMHGAHSGWWRIFFKELPSVGDDGPMLLAESMGGIGCFLLPRYPEVRQAFRNLLNGPSGTAFRDALQESLYDLNPAIRHGAAMVLVVCDPTNESLALEVVVKSRSRKLYGDWYEWERFCLSLSFGPSVLAYLESKLPTLDSSAETFALAILHKNDKKLNEQQRERLIRGLLEVGNWALDPEEPDLSVLAYPDSFESLRTVVENSISKDAAKAADKLLRYHSKRLTLPLYARCAALAISAHSWSLNRLNAEIKRMESDSQYAEAMKEVGNQIVAQGGKAPLLYLIRETLVSQEAWEDVVWRLLCGDSDIPLEYEDNGQWLLDYGRAAPKHGEAIGKAARKFLHDPRLRASPWGDARQWLAILGDEFGGLSKDELEEALSSRGIIRASAASALISRLGHVLRGFRRRDHSSAVPQFSDLPRQNTPVLPEQLARLKELARTSEELHPDVCDKIEELLFEPPLKAEDLDNLAVEGIYGVLIASALSCAYGQSPCPEYVLKLLSFSPRGISGQHYCFKHLNRIWHSGHYLAIEEDTYAKRNYIELLDKALTSGVEEVSVIAAELLALRGYLTGPQIIQVFDYYAKHPEYHDYGLDYQLVKWLSTDLDQQTEAAIIEAVERGLETLDSKPWDFSDGMPMNAFKFLLLPLTYWKLTGKTTELSIRVFLRGIKFTFAKRIEEQETQRLEGQRSEGAVEVMAKIEPLLSKVSKSHLDKAITFGQTVDDLAIRSICRLFTIS
jgi:hypothetical protein